MLRSFAVGAVLWGAVWAATAAGQATGAAAPSPPELDQQIRAILSAPPLSRAHWGVMVTALDGTPLADLHASELFQPASNAKLFTTAAAMALLGPGRTFTTRVTYPAPANGIVPGDLVLAGAGDANLNGATLPYPSHQNPPAPPLRDLAEFADRVAASGVQEIRGGIVGDDTVFPWQPYPQDWAVDDMVWGFGAPVSGLTVEDNQLTITIRPGATAGAPAEVTLDQAAPFYTLAAAVLTTAPTAAPAVQVERAVGSRTVRVFGTIPVGGSPVLARIAITDPAEYAALSLRQMLTDRGVRVDGPASARHRVVDDVQGFLAESRVPLALPSAPVAPAALLPAAIATTAMSRPPQAGNAACTPGCSVVLEHLSPSLGEDVVLTNKTSQNLHAELLLHQLARVYGSDASTVQGARVVRQFLLNAGISPDDFVFYDGSGLSGHDLVTPRAIARLLAYAAHDPATGQPQPWFAAWRASLPVGGVDGSLAGRFTDPPLRGHVFAKTGTLGEARALSGYLDCASGRTVIFSILAGDFVPGSSDEAAALDRVVALIAASL